MSGGGSGVRIQAAAMLLLLLLAGEVQGHAVSLTHLEGKGEYNEGWELCE